MGLESAYLDVPLQVGYSRELRELYNVPRHGKNPRACAFGMAMTWYTNSRAYQLALLHCETRFTIDMTPSEPITDEKREQAVVTLRGMNRRKMGGSNGRSSITGRCRIRVKSCHSASTTG